MKRNNTQKNFNLKKNTSIFLSKEEQEKELYMQEKKIRKTHRQVDK